MRPTIKVKPVKSTSTVPVKSFDNDLFLNAKVNELAKKEDELEERVDIAEAKVDNFGEQIENFNEQIETFSGQIEGFDNRLNTAEEAIQNVSEQVGNVENQLDNINNHLDSVDAHIDNVDTELSLLSTAVSHKQDELSLTQLDAVNSGITIEKVTKYDSYETSKANVEDVYTKSQTYNKTETEELLNNHRDCYSTDDITQLSSVINGGSVVYFTEEPNTVLSTQESVPKFMTSSTITPQEVSPPQGLIIEDTQELTVSNQEQNEVFSLSIDNGLEDNNELVLQSQGNGQSFQLAIEEDEGLLLSTNKMELSLI